MLCAYLKELFWIVFIRHHYKSDNFFLTPPVQMLCYRKCFCSGKSEHLKLMVEAQVWLCSLHLRNFFRASERRGVLVVKKYCNKPKTPCLDLRRTRTQALHGPMAPIPCKERTSNKDKLKVHTLWKDLERARDIALS